MTVNIMLWLWFHTLITCGLIQYTRVLKAIARELLGTETLQLLCRGIVLTCTCTWITINQHSLVRLMLSSVSRGLRKSTGSPSVLCYTEKLSSSMNGRLTTVKTAGGQELLLAVFAYTDAWKTLAFYPWIFGLYSGHCWNNLNADYSIDFHIWSR